MAYRPPLLPALVVVFGAILYQLLLKEIVFNTFGLGRKIELIEEFPYNCRRLQHERLEACEDLWLDHEGRVLYAACAGTEHRLAWNPAIARLDVSGRRPEGVKLVALDADSPGSDGFFGLRTIEPNGYSGAAGEDTLDLLGFNAEIIDNTTIHFYLVNQRPPVDSQLKYIDATKAGANSTIEVFEVKRGHQVMKHLRTVHSAEIWSPNRIAILGKGAFVVTNDHSAKTGFRKSLDPVLGGGNVAYCSGSGKCHAATDMLKFPNGLVKGRDGLIYVPGTIDGKIRVFSLNSTSGTLHQVDVIETKMPLDNIAVDGNGDMFVAAFPNMLKTIMAFEDPFNTSSPATVLRIRKTASGYKVDKVLEDGEGKVLNGITTAVHDAKTGRLWIGAAFSPYLVVCDPK